MLCCRKAVCQQLGGNLENVLTHHCFEFHLQTPLLSFQFDDVVLLLLPLDLELSSASPLPLFFPLALELPLCSLKRTRESHLCTLTRQSVECLVETFTSFLSISLCRSSSRCLSSSLSRSSLFSSSFRLLSSASRASFSLLSCSSLCFWARRSCSLLSASCRTCLLFSNSAFPRSRLALNLSSNVSECREESCLYETSLN